MKEYIGFGLLIGFVDKEKYKTTLALSLNAGVEFVVPYGSLSAPATSFLSMF